MGYCARCEGEIELKNHISKEKITEIRKILYNIYEDVAFLIDGNKFFVRHDDKYFEDETLEALRKIVNDVEKAKIDYSGEDGQEWAFTIKNGNIYELAGLVRDESAYKNSTLIYGEEPNIECFRYTLQADICTAMDKAFSEESLDLSEMLAQDIENCSDFTDCLSSILALKYCDEQDKDGQFSKLEDAITSKFASLDSEELFQFISVDPKPQGYYEVREDGNILIDINVNANVDLLNNAVIHLFTDKHLFANMTKEERDEITRLLNEPVKDISWINGEFRVETTKGDKFTIHKDGSVTVDDDMQNIAKEDKPKNKGYER